jgi:predicted phage tail protein
MSNPSPGGTPSKDPGNWSGFLSGVASVLLILFGVALAGPGVCYLALTRTTVDATVPLIFMAGLSMIAGGIVWLSESRRARRARRRRQG